MLAYIRGELQWLDEDEIVIDVNGLGYKIKTSFNVINKMPCSGSIVFLYTYMHIREDDISIFGFLSKDEITIFKLLISISGVGPKAALSIMSTLSIDELRLAILSNDTKSISKANGIGIKTAQRVAMELKDKFKLEDSINVYSNNSLENCIKNDNVNDVAIALTNLGYSNVEALRAIKKVTESDKLSTEQLLKEALKNIF